MFTLRDLNRRPAKVLEAVRKDGRADIRTRSGEEFSFIPKDGLSERVATKALPDFEARGRRLRELGLVPPPASEMERFNRIIAGER